MPCGRAVPRVAGRAWRRIKLVGVIIRARVHVRVCWHLFFVVAGDQHHKLARLHADPRGVLFDGRARRALVGVCASWAFDPDDELLARAARQVNDLRKRFLTACRLHRRRA